MCGGGSRQSAPSTQVSNNAPWSAQQPYLTRGFDEALTQYEDTSKPSFFPDQTYANFDPATQQALGQQEQRALQGNPLTGQAQQQASATLSGDYLNAGNPYQDQLNQRIMGDVRQGVDSSFAGAGRYGSGLHAEALSRGMGDALAPVMYQNYQNERGMQQNAMQTAPSLAQQDYFDIGQLANVGAAREGQAQRGITENMQRYDFEQNRDRMKLADFMGLIQGNYGSQVQSSMQQPIYSNGLATGVGALTGLGGLGLQAYSAFSKGGGGV